MLVEAEMGRHENGGPFRRTPEITVYLAAEKWAMSHLRAENYRGNRMAPASSVPSC